MRHNLPFVLSVVILLSSAASAQLAVPAFDPAKDPILGTEPLRGFRALPPGIIFADNSTEQPLYGVSVDTFAYSASQVEPLVAALRHAGGDPSKATWKQWFDASCSHGVVVSPSDTNVVYVPSWSTSKVVADVNLIANLPATELLDCKSPTTFAVGIAPHQRHYLKMNSESAIAFQQSYWALANAYNVEESHTLPLWSFASSVLDDAPKLMLAAELQQGSVTFGKPTVLSAAEAGLTIPMAIEKRYDVYGVFFAVSFRDVELSEVDSLVFEVALADTAVALDLVPLRFDAQVSTTVTTGTPSVKVGGGPVSVDLGGIYQRQIVFKSLKPTVQAFGLQEHNFSWKVSGDGAQLGAMRFLAILGVEKEAKDLTAVLSAAVVFKQKWFVQGGRLSTGARPAVLALR